MDMYGLVDRDFEYIKKSLERFPEIERAILFGSRALGNQKKGSDVDIAIFGEAVTEDTLIGLYDWLNEVYPLPYVFDLHDFKSIFNENLKSHINIFGKELYRKTSDL